MKSGFTLIELSIVLVIIGLLVGGILTGRDLIDAASQRAQIAQIEKYNTAVHTFQGKYGGLPGDLPNPYASQFGFTARGTGIGQGDGNGVLQGNHSQEGWAPGSGEIAVFWNDLSMAGLIEGAYNTSSETSDPGTTVTGLAIAQYFPPAKINPQNYVYIWSTNNNASFSNNYPNPYYGISAVTSIVGGTSKISSSLSITVNQAAAIDRKADDGLPNSGGVIAVGLNNDPCWPSSTFASCGSGSSYDLLYNTSPPAISGSSTTCFDNAGNTSNTPQYSTALAGSSLNCALSFRFQ